LTRTLSIFSFEGFIFDYPVDREKIQEWLESEDCLIYPTVPDIPGPTYWDEFYLKVVKEAQNNPHHDFLIMTEIEEKSKETKKRIEFLLKTVKIEEPELILKSKRETLDSFYKRNINFYLSNHKLCKEKYSEINIYLNDFELTNMLGDSIRKNFNIKTVLHDI